MDKKEIETHMILSEYISSSIAWCYGITKDPESRNFMIVMGYVQNGSLRQHLNNSFNSTEWNEKLDILYDIARGLNNIHKKGLIHRDFHCEPKNAIDNKDDDNSFGEYSESIEAIDFITKLDLDKSS
ncbi:kinase-like domain-containing protein [Rhizophagus irregularis DAOM 181602=DAOM 197198]|nr:kinase-like domain-containing protein [Rhizophagus irregularis DAOM 181602=DAOM 197198]